MNFGGAPKEFQRIMDRIFRKELDEKWLRIYIDDIMIKAETVSEFCHRLRRVFNICRNKGLTLKPTKCRFLLEEVHALGWVIKMEK